MPSTRRGMRTRRHLMERCSVVFDRNGFSAATLNQMVDASGYTRGAFYFHFASKDALAQAIVTDQAARWAELLQQVRMDETDPLRVLVRFSYSAAALHESDVVVRAASRLLGERALIGRDLPQTYPWWVETVHGLLVEANEAGQLTETASQLSGGPGLDALAAYLVASWHGNQQRVAHGATDLATHMGAGWHLTLSTICRAPEPRDGMLALNAELNRKLATDPAALVAELRQVPPAD